MGNCHKNHRICEFINNNCPQIFLDCFQLIFPRKKEEKDDIDKEQQQRGEDQNNNQQRQSDQQDKDEQTLPGQQCHYHCRTITNQNGNGNDNDNQSITSTKTFSSSSHHHCYHHNYNHHSDGTVQHQFSIVSHRYHRQYSSNNGKTIEASSLKSKLKLDLQRHLDGMIQRQRSASHCPHTATIGTDKKDLMNKCCCCQKRNQQQTSNIVADPLIQKMVQQGLSPSTSTLNISGRQKRASSLRVLNRRFNFFDTSFNNTSTNPLKSINNPNIDSSLSSRNSSRRGSRRHQKRQQTKMMDLGDQCFLAIFEYLTLQEKLYYERVCHRWQHLIRRSLQAPASLKIGEHSVKCNCQCSHYPSWDLPPSKRFSRDKTGYIIYPKTIIKYLLTLCSQLRCINFSHCYLDDETLQIIIDHSDMIECLHLNDIRLEEDGDNLINGLLEKSSKHLGDTMSNGHQGDQETISSAVGAFASEQLAVFGGLMRKLSTRRSLKKKANNTNTGNVNTKIDEAKRHSDASVMSKRSTGSAESSSGQLRGGTTSNNYSSAKVVESSTRSKTLVNHTKSTPPSSSGTSRNTTLVGCVGKRTAEMLPLLPSGMNRTISNLSATNTTTTTTANNHSATFLEQSSVYYPHEDMRASLENIIRKANLNNQPPPSQQQQQQQPPQKFQRKVSSSATQRRHEWSKHRTINNKSNNANLMSDEQLMLINVINDTANSNDSLLITNDDGHESSLVTSSFAYGTGLSNLGSGETRQYHHLSPNIAPNISSLQTDSEKMGTRHTTSHSLSGSSGNSSNYTGSMMTGNQIAEMNSSEINSHYNSSYHSSSQPLSQQVYMDNNQMNNQIDNNKMDHIQAYVEQEQLRHELRQTHLLKWKAFAKKLGSQIRCLSLGSLSSIDSIVIDILLKYSSFLEELRINNEIDILSYLSIIKHTVKKIYINCEHGIGLECVSLLAYRNYAEKVISLGRVDVPPDLIDSVISTIGSNFCNLRSLHLRLHNFDIDVTTPANLLFDNLNELNLQFVSGNADQPFKKFIQLGWSSVRNLTIQYASITEESVRAIHEHMPQLKKLVLYAIEFRCDHLARRYGHRICTNCSHTVWKSIATLPHLNHFKLHRVIIDDEICKALSRMHRLTNLELQYCSNVNENVINVCIDLARRSPRRRFMLCIISRGFVTFKPPIDCNNLYIDVKVACK